MVLKDPGAVKTHQGWFEDLWAIADVHTAETDAERSRRRRRRRKVLHAVLRSSGMRAIRASRLFQQMLLLSRRLRPVSQLPWHYQSPPRRWARRAEQRSRAWWRRWLEQPAGAPHELLLGRCRVSRPSGQTLNGCLGRADAAALAAPQGLNQPVQVRRGASVSDTFCLRDYSRSNCVAVTAWH